VKERSTSDRNSSASPEVEERVVFVKGGRRFSFSAIVVVGNRNGMVGYGFGKANEVADAIRKGGDIARRSMFQVTLKDRTIPHEVTGQCDGGYVLLKPASAGTGVIAGGGMRAVLELSGVHDVKATIDALENLRSREEILAARQG
jgi:small subunit ribosomal protein S5